MLDRIGSNKVISGNFEWTNGHFEVNSRPNILLTGYPVIFFMESLTNLHQFLTLCYSSKSDCPYSEIFGIVQSVSEELKTFLRHFNITSSAFVNSPIDSKRFSKKKDGAPITATREKNNPESERSAGSVNKAVFENLPDWLYLTSCSIKSWYLVRRWIGFKRYADNGRAWLSLFWHDWKRDPRNGPS